MAEGANIKTIRLFAGKVLTAGADVTTDAIDLEELLPIGFFSLQSTVSGTGTVTTTYSLSNDGVTYVAATDAIATDQAAGTAFYEIKPVLARYMKITATESGASNPATITTTLAVQ